MKEKTKMIQKDCWIYIKEGDNHMSAKCSECHKKDATGWYWPGESKGYGDYDVNCAICGEPINKRE